MRIAFSFLALLLIFVVDSAFGTPSRHDLELWVELQPIAGEPNPQPISRDEAARRLLEEARFVFSGMLYGFEFRYVPLDRERSVAEEFVLSPVAVIPWGGEQLTILDIRHEENLMYGRLRYTLAAHEETRRDAWARSSVTRASGSGSASRILGTAAKQIAIEDAVRNAVHEYLRARVYNKPREVSGRLVLSAAPRVILRSGEYQATVQVKLVVQDLRSYAVY